ncbi:MAG TPA: ABC transporter ATP-binding protein [Acidimicrobiales bacterium]|nr:ABC transporter ATP-binding protein [Acidimicrobiales bacterium]
MEHHLGPALQEDLGDALVIEQSGGIGHRISRSWHDLTYGARHPGRRVAALAGLGVVAGLGESAVVVLVVRLAAGGTGLDSLPGADALPSGTVVLGGLALGVLAVLAAAHLASAVLTARVGAEAEHHVRLELLDTYLAAPWAAQSADRLGQLQDLVLRNASLVGHGAQQAATAVAAGVNLVVVVVAAAAISVWSTAGVVVIAALAVGVARPFRSRTQRVAHRAASTTAMLAAEVAETAQLAREVAVFGGRDAARARVADLVAVAAHQIEAVRTSATAVPALTRDVTVAVLVVGLVVVVGTVDVPLTVLGATVVLLLRALSHAQTIAGVSHRLAERTSNLERIRRQLAAWRTLRPAVRGSLPVDDVGEVVLEGVGYTYPGASRPALREVDLRIGRHEQVGIIGRTGAGKTTLAGLLLGVLEAGTGRLEVDGVPLGDLNPVSWRRLTAWVPQDPQLLTGTIAENIRFLRHELDDAAVLDAAEHAGLTPELAAWPDGIGHHAGPGGSSLSGGQRQRVALARALAGSPRLLVLDEPTSALDAHTEAAVRQALAALRATTTVVVIAHRLSTLDACDRVVVLDEGALVASGPAAELAQTSAYYREVVALSTIR